ncbi:YdfR family protein [Bradyrhizobium murdochi]|uniref:YdfR family protein n=1 Tax=Bradyrhizobium murdochi TaxID=1038859 RepID=UPI0003F5061E|nr:YdfR family protein [Bradyrhizobium murdochi]
MDYPSGLCQGDTPMPEKQNPTRLHSDGPRTYPGEWARQGEIILRKPWMRVVFMAGLVGCILLVLGIRIAAGP